MRLVVDASVAMNAGESDDTATILCRQFLEVVADKEGPHRVVMTGEIEKEWKNPEKLQYRRSIGWLRRLYANKKIDWQDDDQIFDVDLREQIDRLEPQHPNMRLAMLEDIHLIEAAQATDKTAISLDKRVRRLFVRFAAQIGNLQVIVWVNPTVEEEQAIAWLKKGAPPEAHRKLGYFPANT